MIDLHTHTTASDGRCSPAELVARAAGAGVTILAVTDHDTLMGCDAAEAACPNAGIAFVGGIEITAMAGDIDVHVLGYFIDRRAPALLQFLARQRQSRIDRIYEIVERLALRGIRLDAASIVKPALDDPSRAAGRPWVAKAMIGAGVVKDTSEAFDRWLARGRPAFVPRRGATPADVIARIHDAGGIASLAHPALVARDEWISTLAADGLDAVEAFHSEHDADATARYLALADRLGLLVTGGSDFHGDESHGPQSPGAVSLPPQYYEPLGRRATMRATASGSKTSS